MTTTTHSTAPTLELIFAERLGHGFGLNYDTVDEVAARAARVLRTAGFWAGSFAPGDATNYTASIVAAGRMDTAQGNPAGSRFYVWHGMGGGYPWHGCTMSDWGYVHDHWFPANAPQHSRWSAKVLAVFLTAVSLHCERLKGDPDAPRNWFEDQRDG